MKHANGASSQHSLNVKYSFEKIQIPTDLMRTWELQEGKIIDSVDSGLERTKGDRLASAITPTHCGTATLANA
jgi:hypothetical protein